MQRSILASPRNLSESRFRDKDLSTLAKGARCVATGTACEACLGDPEKWQQSWELRLGGLKCGAWHEDAGFEWIHRIWNCWHVTQCDSNTKELPGASREELWETASGLGTIKTQL